MRSIWGTKPVRALSALFFAMSLGASTGCSALSAITNPSAAWALNEPAPMSVVVRRAEVAHRTALEVKRLLDDTGVDPKSAWIEKVALGREDAKTLLEQASAESVYRAAPMRIVPAEAWAQSLASICSTESSAPSLLALLSPDVAEQYADVTGQDGGLAELKASIEREKDETERAKLEKQLRTVEREHDPKVKALLEKVREDARAAPAAVKEKLAAVVPQLERAVADAKAANAAAMLRYPLAVPGMSSDVQAAAKRFAADVIEEKTGTRPSGDGLKPEVKLDGTDVKLTINGVSSEQLGKLSADELVAETTKRTKAYVERVLGLVGSGGDTDDLLSFEEDLLGAIEAGIGRAPAAAGWGDLTVQSDPKASPPAKKIAKVGACHAASSATAKLDTPAPKGSASSEKPAPADKSGALIGGSAPPKTASPPAALAKAPAAPAAKPRAKSESSELGAPAPGGPDLRLVPGK